MIFFLPSSIPDELRFCQGWPSLYPKNYLSDLLTFSANSYMYHWLQVLISKKFPIAAKLFIFSPKIYGKGMNTGLSDSMCIDWTPKNLKTCTIRRPMIGDINWKTLVHLCLHYKVIFFLRIARFWYCILERKKASSFEMISGSSPSSWFSSLLVELKASSFPASSSSPMPTWSD